MLFYNKNILIVGLGLMGASLGQALIKRRQSKDDFKVLGYARKQQTVDIALDNCIIDQGSSDLESMAKQADIIVLCVPMLSIESSLQAIKPFLKDQVILTDVGSVKDEVIRASKKVFGNMPNYFVPGHPIAGAEKSGVMAANSELYDCHQVILTPDIYTDKIALNTIESIWKFVGAHVVEMNVEHHDHVLAATSHLPHLLAFSLVNTLNHRSENREIFHYAAGGFRDFTRIAASETTMWHDIFKCNKDALLEVLNSFTADLDILKEAISSNDEQTIKSVLSEAKTAREYFTEVLQARSNK
ncbi:prephenate dehydrogenase/arogenate dehydrogenase family protein [Marinicellulosiphila megalodicopiae]|uniref:prephenate dehydrogenase/arogenate dehydrogenase family protein n=1 Tax=Marinicellulosiphila megalodicopiae TaxID=2724896 RepID=UPI003BB19DDB